MAGQLSWSSGHGLKKWSRKSSTRPGGQPGGSGAARIGWGAVPDRITNLGSERMPRPDLIWRGYCWREPIAPGRILFGRM